ERFVTLKRKGKDGKERPVVVSLRAEAERRLAGMPAEGRAYYEKEYGPPAAVLVRQARILNEPSLLAEAMRRFLHTRAGAEAAERLGTHLTDSGRAVAAAFWF